jgi:hypothetical protein
MPGLVPGIHGNRHSLCGGSWMAGSSPAMTVEWSMCLRLNTRSRAKVGWLFGEYGAAVAAKQLLAKAAVSV